MTTMRSLFRLTLSVVVLSLTGCAANLSAPVSDRNMPVETTGELPAAEAGTSALPPQPTTYVVQPGDTLNRIAQKFGYTFKELAEWNQMADPNQISVGQTVRVAPPDGVTVTPISIGQPSIGSMPASSSSAPAPATTTGGVKNGPLAIVEPYSDAAWARIRQAPSATPASKPEAAPSVPAPGVSTPPPAAAGSSEWLWPASGKVVSTFSNGETKGIDIAGKLGDPVRASSSGRVVYAGAGLRGYGKLVIIKHDADYLSAYAHNKNLLVKEGQSVTQGQTIAELGQTDADRPKLHFEIRRRGKPVDPLTYLPKR
ncbi:peptidoglycan DD-metalloendopeptidase family protein [Denitromonas halophila]|uniref:Peptidoglycan DD-metalloendopeptidase family protein n=1 Tax=Denitromonas halophila TaxID=1629404 RepID=A0A557QJQ8_9RHOO|nr:peptidoglycan DD-metalloendopeptidase family protein [Denitromonas halophila]TVO53143.1 peptidoglycan DD-metalloendopeptidase family protein [Denitromonas halophila]